MTAITADNSSDLEFRDVFEALGSLVEKKKLGEAGQKLESFFAVFGTADTVAKEVTHEEQGICGIIHKALVAAKDGRLLRIANEQVKDVKRANYTKAVIDAFTGLAKKVREVIIQNEFVKNIVAKAQSVMATNTNIAKDLARKVGGLAGITAEHVVAVEGPSNMRSASTDSKIGPQH